MPGRGRRAWRRRALALLLELTALLAPSAAFAYGGFESDSMFGMLVQTAPMFFRGIAYVVLPYLLCSWLLEKTPCIFLPVLVYLAYVGFYILPKLMIMGEIGPDDAAVPLVGVASVAFPALLLVKYLVFVVRARTFFYVRRPTNPG